jgi:hypothetical protein
MVGHVPVDLKRHRTLQTVYLEPIFDILERRNEGTLPNETWIGLLEDDPNAEVQLVIDFVSYKTSFWGLCLPFHRNLEELTCGHMSWTLSALC